MRNTVAVLGCVLLHLIGSRLRIEVTCLAGFQQFDVSERFIPARALFCRSRFD